MSIRSVITGRGMPAEWPELLGAAGNIVSFGEVSHASSDLRQLQSDIDLLGMTELERNIYYAFALSACNLGRILTSEAVRSDVIDRGAIILSGGENSLRQWLGGPLHATGLADAFRKSLEPQTDRAYQDLPADVRFLGNFLTLMRYQRQMTDPTYNRQWAGINPEEIAVSAMRRGDKMLNSEFSRSATNGPAVVIRSIISAREPVDDWRQPPSAATIDFLKHPSVIPAALRACRLKLRDIEEEKFLIIGDGGVKFDEIRLTENTDPTGQSQEELDMAYGGRGRDYYQRNTDESLLCPGIHGGLVPSVMRLGIGMVERAAAMIRAEKS